MSKNFTLNQRRDFGDSLGDGATFLKMNFKPLLSVFLTYVVPLMILPIVLLVMTGSMSSIMDIYSFDAMSNPGDSPFQGFALVAIMLGFFFFYGLAYLTLNLAMYGSFLAYETNGNVPVTADEIKEKMRENLGNYIVSVLVYFGLILLLYIAMIAVVWLAAFIGVGLVFILFL